MALAVAGTSLFYGMFVVLGVVFVVVWGSDLELEDPTASGIVPLMFWCLDSVFNDICAVYLGCGPPQAALDLVIQASQADAVGMPVAGAGQVLGAPAEVQTGACPTVAKLGPRGLPSEASQLAA